MTHPAAPELSGRTTEDPLEFLDALSDVTRTIASPLETIWRSKFTADAKRLLSLATEHGVTGFVVGFPRNLDGTEGPRAQATRALARNLNKLSPLPILLWDERLTTAQDAKTSWRGHRQTRSYAHSAERARSASSSRLKRPVYLRLGLQMVLPSMSPEFTGR